MTKTGSFTSRNSSNNNNSRFLSLYHLGVVLLVFQACLAKNIRAAASEVMENTDKDVLMSVVPTGTLSNGIEIPLVGLGCASGVRKAHVKSALSMGYRFLDTAQSYNWGYHEDEVGLALQEFTSANNNSDNDKVFVQTKIHPEDLGYEATKRAVQLSFKRLKTDFIDSVLIHKPKCWPGACRKEPEGTWQESWKALEEFYHAGKIGAIGICDVHPQLLQELLQQTVKPHIIQNWMDPFHQDVDIRNQCQQAGIQYQAYSTLGTQWAHHRGYKNANPVLTSPTLIELARKYNVDVAQVVLHWATRHQISVLPASTNPQRQEKNLIETFSFQLTDDEMTRIDALDGKVPPPPMPQKEDPNMIHVQFENQSNDGGSIQPYWVNEDTKEEVPVGEALQVGQRLEVSTYHGHKFVFRNTVEGSNAIVGEHIMSRQDGKEQSHAIGGHGEL